MYLCHGCSIFTFNYVFSFIQYSFCVLYSTVVGVSLSVFLEMWNWCFMLLFYENCTDIRSLGIGRWPELYMIGVCICLIWYSLCVRRLQSLQFIKRFVYTGVLSIETNKCRKWVKFIKFTVSRISNTQSVWKIISCECVYHMSRFHSDRIQIKCWTTIRRQQRCRTESICWRKLCSIFHCFASKQCRQPEIHAKFNGSGNIPFGLS